jgi:hypothetical protein
MRNILDFGVERRCNRWRDEYQFEQSSIDKAAHANSDDQVFANWGRIQQAEGTDYAMLLGESSQLDSSAECATDLSDEVLEEFQGFVDKISGDVAYVTLRTIAGEILWSEFPVSELAARGIRERRRFKCWTVRLNSEVRLKLEAIPDAPFSAEDEHRLEERLRRDLGDDDAPQNDA